MKKILINTVRTLFYFWVLTILFYSYSPVALKAHPKLLQSLFSKEQTSHIKVGTEYKLFQEFLSKENEVSFIADKPYEGNSNIAKMHHRAQNYLCPVKINTEPTQIRAIVFCSNDSIAEKRMKETGYVMERNLGNGKGIAVKK